VYAPRTVLGPTSIFTSTTNCPPGMVVIGQTSGGAGTSDVVAPIAGDAAATIAHAAATSAKPRAHPASAHRRGPASSARFTGRSPAAARTMHDRPRVHGEKCRKNASFRRSS